MTEISCLIQHIQDFDSEFLLPYIKLIKQDANMGDVEMTQNIFFEQFSNLNTNGISTKFSPFLALAETLEVCFNSNMGHSKLFGKLPAGGSSPFFSKPVCFQIQAELVPRLIFSQANTPRIEEVLFCSPETTYEEISCFILRWARIYPKTGRLFFLIGLHFLKYEFQMKVCNLFSIFHSK